MNVDRLPGKQRLRHQSLRVINMATSAQILVSGAVIIDQMSFDNYWLFSVSDAASEEQICHLRDNITYTHRLLGSSTHEH